MSVPDKISKSPRLSYCRDQDLELQLIKTVPYSSDQILTPTNESEEKSAFSTVQGIHDFPLHDAVQAGNTRLVNELLNTALSPMRQDYKGRTPLHFAAAYGDPHIGQSMTNLILKCPYFDGPDVPNDMQLRLINIQDVNGEAPLHLAAKNANRQIVTRLLFCGADVNLRSKEKKEPIELIYSKVPKAMLAVFNKAITKRDADLTGKESPIYEDNFEVQLDFGAIVGYPDEEEIKKALKHPIETQLLIYALRNSEKKFRAIILHPLVQLFLHLKWRKIRILFWLSITFHIFWLLIYQYFVINLYLHRCPYLMPKDALSPLDLHEKVSSTTDVSNLEEEEEFSQEPMMQVNSDKGVFCGADMMNIKLTFAILTASVLIGMKEIYEMCTVPHLKYYFGQLENIGQVLLISLAFVTALPVIMAYKMVNSDFVFIRPWQYECAALGVFLAWMLILSQIGKTPILGIYIEILVKVLKSFVLFIATFISLLTGFALSFSILMPNNKAFNTSIPLALSKVLVMMTGELNYDEVFHNEDEEPMPFPVLGHFVFSFFTIIVTIILFNLLIGFTVSDIQGLESRAQVSTLSSQLEQIYLMESFLFNSGLERFLSIFGIKTQWMSRFLVADVSEDMCVYIPTKKIPRYLIKDVRKQAALNLTGGSEERGDEDKEKIKLVVEEVLRQLNITSGNKK